MIDSESVSVPLRRMDSRGVAAPEMPRRNRMIRFTLILAIAMLVSVAIVATIRSWTTWWLPTWWLLAFVYTSCGLHLALQRKRPRPRRFILIAVVWQLAIAWTFSLPFMAILALDNALAEWADPEWEPPFEHVVAWVTWYAVTAFLLGTLLAKVGRWLMRGGNKVPVGDD